MFGLLQNTYARAGDITVRITDIQYGIATRSGRPITGSFIDQVPTSFEIVEVTDRIPMTPGTYFGIEMDVHASEGKTLQIAVTWQGPDGATLNNKTVAGSIRNGGQLKKSFSFAASDNPGNWILKVFLIGIDSSINEIKSSDVALGSMKLYERSFKMYEEKDQ